MINKTQTIQNTVRLTVVQVTNKRGDVYFIHHYLVLEKVGSEVKIIEEDIRLEGTNIELLAYADYLILSAENIKQPKKNNSNT